ncbi:vacuolar sorting protein VPS33/slp1 [Nowakowskiella sp. JEL0407]|nr:vacuolar sorting protein VPS33/slp1 [Nowakowskiella sp. JEL0407]
MDFKIPSVESITRKRKNCPNNDAIYFIHPTVESAQIILDDLEANKYAAAHIFSVSITPDEVLNVIRHSKTRSKMKCFIDLCVDFFAFAPSVFHLNNMEATLSLYTPQDLTEFEFSIKQTAQQLISIITALKEDPKIRYFDPHGTRSTLSARIAYQTQLELDLYKQDEPDYPPKTKYAQAELLILDRSVDLIAPFMHEVTYQSLVHDLLAVEGHQVTFAVDGDKTKTCTLDYKDSIWETAKNLFLSDCIEEIQKFRKELEQNPNALAELNKDQVANSGLDGVRERLAALPAFLEKKEKFANHVSILNELKMLFSQRNLENVALLEQQIAIAMPKFPADAFRKLFELLDNQEIRFSSAQLVMIPGDKLRSLVIFVTVVERRWFSEEDWKKALQDVGIDGISKFFSGIDYLTPGLREMKWDKMGDYAYSKRVLKPSNEWEMHRYRPDIKSNNLSQRNFPYVADYSEGTMNEASRGSGTIIEFKGHFKPSWGKRRRRGGDDGSGQEDYRANGGRIIVFIVGAATFPEIRVSQEFTQTWKREVLLGSHLITNPALFTELIDKMSNQSVPKLSLQPTPVYEAQKPGSEETKPEQKEHKQKPPAVTPINTNFKPHVVAVVNTSTPYSTGQSFTPQNVPPSGLASKASSSSMKNQVVPKHSSLNLNKPLNAKDSKENVVHHSVSLNQYRPPAESQTPSPPKPQPFAVNQSKPLVEASNENHQSKYDTLPPVPVATQPQGNGQYPVANPNRLSGSHNFNQPSTAYNVSQAPQTKHNRPPMESQNYGQPTKAFTGVNIPNVSQPPPMNQNRPPVESQNYGQPKKAFSPVNMPPAPVYSQPQDQPVRPIEPNINQPSKPYAASWNPPPQLQNLPSNQFRPPESQNINPGRSSNPNPSNPLSSQPQSQSTPFSSSYQSRPPDNIQQSNPYNPANSNPQVQSSGPTPDDVRKLASQAAAKYQAANKVLPSISDVPSPTQPQTPNIPKITTLEDNNLSSGPPAATFIPNNPPPNRERAKSTSSRPEFLNDIPARPVSQSNAPQSSVEAPSSFLRPDMPKYEVAKRVSHHNLGQHAQDSFSQYQNYQKPSFPKPQPYSSQPPAPKVPVDQASYQQKYQQSYSNVAPITSQPPAKPMTASYQEKYQNLGIGNQSQPQTPSSTDYQSIYKRMDVPSIKTESEQKSDPNLKYQNVYDQYFSNRPLSTDGGVNAQNYGQPSGNQQSQGAPALNSQQQQYAGYYGAFKPQQN